MEKSNILTDRELNVINKKLKNKKLTQQDSNYLSRFVRPKLKEVLMLNAKQILGRLEYNQKAISIENKIKKKVLGVIKNPVAVIIYGSAVQTNYKYYNDMDVLIITNKKLWKTQKEKYQIISLLAKKSKEEELNLDIQIIDKKSFERQYPCNASLVYQLKDSKIIYGKIKLSNKISLSKLDLRMKLDWSDIVDESSEGLEIYNSLRNVILVRLLSRGIIDNYTLNNILHSILGNDLINKLKSNTAAREERLNVLKITRILSCLTLKELVNSKWERIEL